MNWLKDQYGPGYDLIMAMEQGQAEDARRKNEAPAIESEPGFLADCDALPPEYDRLMPLPVWQLVCLSQGIEAKHFSIRTADVAQTWARYFQADKRERLEALLKLHSKVQTAIKLGKLPAIDEGRNTTAECFYQWAVSAGVRIAPSFIALAGPELVDTPATAKPESVPAPATTPRAKGARWTNDDLRALLAYRDTRTEAQTAAHYGISDAMVRRKVKEARGIAASEKTIVTGPWAGLAKRQE